MSLKKISDGFYTNKGMFAQEQDWTQSSVRGKPVAETDNWDGDTAIEDILAEYRNEDGTVNSTEARKWCGFFDNSSDGNNQEDYKHPIGRRVDGELRVTEGGVKASRRFLSATKGVSQSEKDAHGDVLSHYERRLDIGE